MAKLLLSGVAVGTVLMSFLQLNARRNNRQSNL
jgi:hypothetical protein